jgi:formamidopyrimidine-DNA glycosylase
MPELPEVETIARGVDARVRGDRVVEAWFSTQPQPFKTPRARQQRGLAGRVFLSVHRTGKHIVCEMGPAGGPALSEHRKANARPADAHPADAHPADAQWIVHLGMTGRLLVTTPEEPVARHTHARLRLASGRELRFVDPRRFGRLEFRELKRGPGFDGRGFDGPGFDGPGFEAPGAEPLTIGAEEFAALFRGRRTPIKAALLNQSLLAGVGNIYADESLFHAGVRPRRLAGRLTRQELERLRAALVQVLQEAIKLGGSSVSDYVDADGARGFFQLEHCVYMRTGEPCRRCAEPIRRIVLAGRGTHFCPKCQR